MALAVAPTVPRYIQVGPGGLWTGVAKPADGAILQVSGYASGAYDQRLIGPVMHAGSGIFIGSTIGESSFSYRPTFVDIQIETSTSKVEKVLNMEEARLMFSVAELTTNNLQLTIPIGTVTSGGDTSNKVPFGTKQQLYQAFTVGGLRLTAPTCIAFTSANRRILTNEGPYSYVFCGYAAIPVDGFDAPFSRGRETVWRLSYELIGDTVRSLGDQLFQFVVRRNPDDGPTATPPGPV